MEKWKHFHGSLFAFRIHIRLAGLASQTWGLLTSFSPFHSLLPSMNPMLILNYFLSPRHLSPHAVIFSFPDILFLLPAISCFMNPSLLPSQLSSCVISNKLTLLSELSFLFCNPIPPSGQQSWLERKEHSSLISWLSSTALTQSRGVVNVSWLMTATTCPKFEESCQFLTCGVIRLCKALVKPSQLC